MVFPDPNAKITKGADFNFFHADTVDNAGFTEDPYIPGVRGPSHSFYIRNTGGQTLEYSFNGNTLHGRITATQDERFFPNRSISKIWFRAPAGSTTVEVEGWASA
jgi:hypothetical protein